MKSYRHLVIACFTLFFFSCEKDRVDIDLPEGFAAPGTAIVLNEGAFTVGNASVSFVDEDGKVTNNIFSMVNGISLGDVAQSFSNANGFGIITVNNSQKVEIVDAETFKSLATITEGLDYPRHSLPVGNDKVYVSNGNTAGTIVVIDLNDFSTSTIAVGDGPEEMIKIGNEVFVANSGGFGVANTLSVIDVTKGTETEKITVADLPRNIEVDANGDIWVLCAGQSDFSSWPLVTKLTEAKLVKVDGTSKEIESEITLVEKDSVGEVSRLAISKDGQTVYYIKDGSIYSHAINSTSASAEPLIEGSGNGFYGLDVHPGTGEIWVTTGGFAGNEMVLRYTSTGVLNDSYAVGIGPNGTFFNQ